MSLRTANLKSVQLQRMSKSFEVFSRTPKSISIGVTKKVRLQLSRLIYDKSSWNSMNGCNRNKNFDLTNQGNCQYKVKSRSHRFQLSEFSDSNTHLV